MATVAAYPTPSNGGPVINKQIDLPEEFQPIVLEYDDGGVDVNVHPCGVKKWRLEYDGLTSAEATVLDDHFNLAKNDTHNFTFYDARTGTNTTNTYYADYEVERSPKQSIKRRRVTLAQYAG